MRMAGWCLDKNTADQIEHALFPDHQMVTEYAARPAFEQFSEGARVFLEQYNQPLMQSIFNFCNEETFFEKDLYMLWDRVSFVAEAAALYTTATLDFYSGYDSSDDSGYEDYPVHTIIGQFFTRDVQWCTYLFGGETGDLPVGKCWL